MIQKTTITAQLYKQGKTHQWLADRLGITPGTLSKWMTGGRPQTLSMIRKCADLLLCEPSALWPEIRLPIDWSHRYDVLTARMMELDVRHDRAEWMRLNSERAAASVHVYTAQQKRKIDCGGYDEYTTGRFREFSI